MNDRITSITKHPAFLPAVSSAVSLSVGMAVGYFIGKKRQRTQDLHDIRDSILDSAPEIVERPLIGHAVNGKDADVIVVDDPLHDDHEEAIEVTHKERVTITITEPDVEESHDTVRRSIFAQDGPDWDLEAEIAARTPDTPYVLHHDEYYNEETDYPQFTYTFFEGDEILVDQEDEIVYNWSERIGPLRWGHGAKDPNVFHVRNEKRKEEYEIIRSTDYYARAIQGLEIEEEAEKELRHSATPPRMKRE